MEIRDFRQAMALQTELTSKLMKRMDTLREGKAPSLEVTMKEKEKLIAQAKANLETSEKERKLAMQRWENRVARQKTTVTRLEKELKDLQQSVAEHEQVVKKKQ